MSYGSSQLRLMLFCAAAFVAATTGCRDAAAPSPEPFLKRGDAYAADNKYAEAIVEYRNAIDVEP